MKKCSKRRLKRMVSGNSIRRHIRFNSNEYIAKRAAAQQAAKKGWGFTGWFGGGAKKETIDPQAVNKPVKANLGEASSFVYDPELKRWVNKKPGAENTEAKKAAPPPPKGPPRSAAGTPPPLRSSSPALGAAADLGRASAPPVAPPRSIPTPTPMGESPVKAPPMGRSVSSTSMTGPPTAPPSRPATSMSNASSIDDLLSSAGPRKPGQKKAKKGGRYVDVMAK
jgi:COPII coat assembly protein SEC16